MARGQTRQTQFTQLRSDNPSTQFTLAKRANLSSRAAEVSSTPIDDPTSADELLVGFYKKDSGKPSITWPESVDEALCFGWIDGIRKRLDEVSYTIRFTPRHSGSIWSAINIKRAEVLTEEGRMRPAGVKAFAARKENKSGIYAYEQRSADLVEPYASVFKRNKAAWRLHQEQPPGYRTTVHWWVTSAKTEETRLRRLQKLIDEAAAGRRVQ